LRKIHSDSRKTYGSPRVFQKFKKTEEKHQKKQLQNLLTKIISWPRLKRSSRLTTDSKHNLNVSPKLLARNFNPENVNQAWCGDITYIHTNEVWLFLATVIDLYSRKIIGWSINKRIKKSIVVDAMNMALVKRKTTVGLIFHSDRGSQYCSSDIREVLKRYGIKQSMSRKGNCWDNAVAECFFNTLKKDLIFHEEFETREEAKRKIFEYIEVFYNRERIHSVLDSKSPIEYELNVA
jgi:transposase InsO family protein